VPSFSTNQATALHVIAALVTHRLHRSLHPQLLKTRHEAPKIIISCDIQNKLPAQTSPVFLHRINIAFGAERHRSSGDAEG
jgi:hypothetical protein